MLAAFLSGTPVRTHGRITGIRISTTTAGYSWGVIRLHGIGLDLVFPPRQWEETGAWWRASHGMPLAIDGLLDARHKRRAVIVRSAEWD